MSVNHRFIFIYHKITKNRDFWAITDIAGKLRCHSQPLNWIPDFSVRFKLPFPVVQSSGMSQRKFSSRGKMLASWHFLNLVNIAAVCRITETMKKITGFANKNEKVYLSCTVFQKTHILLAVISLQMK